MPKPVGGWDPPRWRLWIWGMTGGDTCVPSGQVHIWSDSKTLQRKTGIITVSWNNGRHRETSSIHVWRPNKRPHEIEFWTFVFIFYVGQKIKLVIVLNLTLVSIVLLGCDSEWMRTKRNNWSSLRGWAGWVSREEWRYGVHDQLCRTTCVFRNY